MPINMIPLYLQASRNRKLGLFIANIEENIVSEKNKNNSYGDNRKKEKETIG